MRRTIKIEISGTSYELQQVKARVGGQILLHLGKMIGPLSKGDFDDLFDSLSGASFEYIAQAFAANTVQKMKLETGATIEVDFDLDEEFAGKYGDLITWIRAHFDLNFENFFSDLQKHVPKDLLKKAGLKSTQPSGSTGESGAL